jgi:hypothetical protein
MYGGADQCELGEGVDVTVGAYSADQLGWQGSSSSLDGHRVSGGRKRGWEERGMRGRKVSYNRFRSGCRRKLIR